jgi:hypothetical protein
VDAEVAGEVLDPGGQVEHVGGDLAGRLLFRCGDAAPAVDELSVGVLLAGAVPAGVALALARPSG